MKEKLTRNIGLKVLSIILAAMLWLVITNVDDPVVSKSFDNVPVDIINKEKITNLGEIYEIKEGKSIDFTVAARRTVKEKLTVSDFKVTADFSKLSDVNAVAINITCPRYGNEVTVTDGLNQVMTVNLEELVEKSFKVNVVQKGIPADGYYVAEKTASTIIKVSGPKSKIESISEIVVQVDVSDFAGSFRTTEEPIALDKDGKEIDSSNLKFSDNIVTVNVKMYRTKTIDLQIKASGKPADGYMVTTIEYEPKTIEIAGAADVLYAINNLIIDENTDGVSQNIEKEINIQEQLADGLFLVGDNQTAVVDMSIEKEESKEILIWPRDIETKNNTNNYDLLYLNIGPISVQVTGPASKIDNLTVEDLKPYVDLSNYSSGTYELTIGINTSEFMTLINKPSISVNLKEK